MAKNTPDVKIKLPGLLALSPILVFLAVYLVSSLLAGDFYKVPVSSAFLLASVYAVTITPGKLSFRVNVFSESAGHWNIMLMVWIFMLAGAFAGSAREIGSIEATVNFTLNIIPARFLLAGLFLTACFVSLAIGTSVGTIVALVPIASGIAEETGMSQAMMAGLVVGGSFFGDNLSFISDTTIAATRAVGCAMHEKFRANFLIVLPAVLVVAGYYVFKGLDIVPSSQVQPIEWLKLLPYLSVIILALFGMDVTLVLVIGILLNAVVGFGTDALDWYTLLGSIGDGIAGMGDLIIVTLLAGGMLGIIRHNGGLEYITKGIAGHVHGRKGAELGIGILTSLANLCTANNTIAIITVGGIVNDISDKFDIPKRRAASLMDIFSCFVQGVIPYGAQLLMAAGLTGLASTQIIPYLYYPFAAGISVVLSIFFSRRQPVKGQKKFK
ncbi:MAG: Na+/H+ antiporter NhaC family protein [Bacteroidaceae bacterium]|nr:Na+/H+ antiporter NhaC family protein [Bacteroidaceae bacterium]